MNLETGTTAPSEKICAYEYTVNRGDSFYLISRRLGVSLRDLMAANPSINPARLMVGDVLCIPLEESSQHIAKEPISPTGTTLSDVTGPTEVVITGPTGAVEGTVTGTTEVPIFTCPIEQRRTVQPGQSVSDFQLAADINRHTMELANPNVDLDNLVPGQVLCVPTVNQPCPLPSSYILQANDTLETVAAKFNLSVASLLRANPCLAPCDFLPCVCISLPRM